MIRNSLSVGIFYGSIGFFAGRVNQKKTGNFLVDKSLDVSMASFCKFLAILVTNPLYMLKTRAESMKFNKSHTVLQDMKATYQARGLQGFYQGFWATCIRDVPYQGIQFGIYKLLGELTNSFQQMNTKNDSKLEKIGIFHLKKKRTYKIRSEYL